MGSFTLTLDTTPPVAPGLSLDGGAGSSADTSIDALPSTSDAPPDGYSVLLWGDVDATANPSIQPTEGASSWLAFGDTTVVLAAGDGGKTIHFKLRDDVGNVTGENTAGITLSTFTGPPPVVSITVDVAPNRISEVPGFSRALLTFKTDVTVDQWRVTVAPADDSTVDESTTIGNAHGSITTGGHLVASTPRAVAIEGADLDDVTPADGPAIIKVFANNANGWSE